MGHMGQLHYYRQQIGWGVTLAYGRHRIERAPLWSSASPPLTTCKDVRTPINWAPAPQGRK